MHDFKAICYLIQRPRCLARYFYDSLLNIYLIPNSTLMLFQKYLEYIPSFRISIIICHYICRIYLVLICPFWIIHSLQCNLYKGKISKVIFIPSCAAVIFTPRMDFHFKFHFILNSLYRVKSTIKINLQTSLLKT